MNQNPKMPSKVREKELEIKKTRAAPDPGLYTLSHPFEPVIFLNQHLIRENQLSFGNQGGLDLCNEYKEII